MCGWCALFARIIGVKGGTDNKVFNGLQLILGNAGVNHEEERAGFVRSDWTVWHPMGGPTAAAMELAQSQSMAIGEAV